MVPLVLETSTVLVHTAALLLEVVALEAAPVVLAMAAPVEA